MSGAKSLAIVLIFRAMVAFPAVSAPRPPDRGPDRVSCSDSLAHHSGKRNWACAMRHGLRQMTLKLQRPARVQARNGARPYVGRVSKDGPRSTKLRMNCPADGESVDPRQIHGQLTVPWFDRWDLARGILELRAREATRR